MVLEVTTIPGVAVLKVGRGFQGHGCPVKGCDFTVADLDDIALAYAETRYLRPVPIKIGHDDDQKVLESEGMAAAGWIENVRRVGVELYADFVDVPRRVAELIRSKSYRSRSAELSTITVDGKRYRMALTAVALLGADLPAVPGLPDVVWFSHRHGHVCDCEDDLASLARMFGHKDDIPGYLMKWHPGQTEQEVRLAIRQGAEQWQQ
jgi:hypothetical protein